MLVETPEQIGVDCRSRREGWRKILRGGAFKPRSSPTAFRDTAKKAQDDARGRRTEAGCRLQ